MDNPSASDHLHCGNIAWKQIPAATPYWWGCWCLAKDLKNRWSIPACQRQCCSQAWTLFHYLALHSPGHCLKPCLNTGFELCFLFLYNFCCPRDPLGSKAISWMPTFLFFPPQPCLLCGGQKSCRVLRGTNCSHACHPQLHCPIKFIT